MYHTGLREQRGRGIGSILSGIMRGFAPIAKLGLRAGKSLLQNPTVRNVGKQALSIAADSAKNLIADVVEGKNSEERAKEELQMARSKIASTLRGGRKRKKNIKIVKAKKVRRYNLLD